MDVTINGNTSLTSAARRKDESAMQIALNQAGVDVNFSSLFCRETALEITSKSDTELYLTQLLLAHGADPTMPNAYGYNAFHIAVGSRAVQTIHCLATHSPKLFDDRRMRKKFPLVWEGYLKSTREALDCHFPKVLSILISKHF